MPGNGPRLNPVAAVKYALRSTSYLANRDINAGLGRIEHTAVKRSFVYISEKGFVYIPEKDDRRRPPGGRTGGQRRGPRQGSAGFKDHRRVQVGDVTCYVAVDAGFAINQSACEACDDSIAVCRETRT